MKFDLGGESQSDTTTTTSSSASTSSLSSGVVAAKKNVVSSGGVGASGGNATPTNRHLLKSLNTNPPSGASPNILDSSPSSTPTVKLVIN